MKRLCIFVLLVLSSGLVSNAQNAAAQRSKAIEKTKQEINKELKAEGGDWLEWFMRLAPVRQEFSDVYDEAGKYPRKPANQPNAHVWNYITAQGNPPFFVQHASTLYLFADHLNASTYVGNHKLMDSTPQALATPFAAIPALLAFSKWLRSANIDLIFVPVPKMVELYPDRVVKNVPADKIAAPHMRKLFLDLSDQNIEIVDLLPEYLRAEKADPEPLVMPSDSHWSDRAQQIAAKLIGERLKRYSFVTHALAKPKIYRTDEVPWTFLGSDWDYLTPEEQQAVARHPKKPLLHVTNLDGSAFAAHDDAEVVIGGDSYADYQNSTIAKGTGIAPLISREINLPVSIVSTGGATTQLMTDLIRDREGLKNRKVVVWIISMDEFTWPMSWEVPAFPVLTNAAPK